MNRAKIIELATKEIGYTEDPPGSNKTKYGAEFGFDGVQWCCIFYMHILKHSSNVIPYGPHAYNKNGYASVPGYYIDHKNGSTSDPQPGDAVIFDWEKGKQASGDWTSDHIGIFKEWIDKKAGTFFTIEGNTSVGNQSNGGAVMLRQRNLAFVQAFIGLPNL